MAPSTSLNRRVRSFALVALVLLAGPVVTASLAAGVGAVGSATSAGPDSSVPDPSSRTEPVENVTEAVDDATETVTETADDSTDPVTETADDTTDAVNGTADDTTDGTVDETTDAVDGTLNDTTDALGDETGDVTGTLDSGLDDALGSAGALEGEATAGVAGTTTDGANHSGADTAGDTNVAPAESPGAAATDGDGGSRRGGGLPEAAAGAALLQRSAGSWSWRFAASSWRWLPSEPGEWLRWLGGLAGYSRYDDSDPLDHDTRRTLHRRIADSPGVHLSALSAEVGVPVSTARHHLRVLATEGVVQTTKIRGKRCYFPASTDRPTLEAALADETQAAVLETLAEVGRATVTELAEELGLDASTATYQLQRMEAADLVERERDGRQVWNRLAPGIGPLVEGAPFDPPTD